MIDTIKGIITYVTAATISVGSMILAFVAWNTPIPEGGGRDLAVLFGFFGLLAGAAAGFLFGQESATRATRAAESTTTVATTAATTGTPPPPRPPGS